METLYRKVEVSERKPNKGGQYFTDKNLVNYLTNGQWHHIRDPHTEFPEWWLEEIPDTTARLKADKEELLEALEKVRISLLLLPDEFSDEINSLIQKHKQ